MTFTRSLALQLIKRGIRVNGVAPGPIWTPLEVASLPVDKIVTFGSQAGLDRAGQPFELAPSYVFLASNECSSYFTGQFLHPNGMPCLWPSNRISRYRRSYKLLLFIL